jgi:8-hydroxy-5-deazaflavin:NADPH oxidoreductase
MRVAVIGTGKMGSGLATAFARAGHDVVLGSRNPEGAAEKARAFGASGATTYPEAVRGADVVVLAIPWRVVQETLPTLGDLDGTILIDITNPYVDGKLQRLPDTSTTELIQSWAPAARVVKGWNHVWAQNLTAPGEGDRAESVMLASDDPGAKEVVAGLARDIGFHPVDVGGAIAARPLTDLNDVLAGLGLGPDRPLRVLER